MRTLSRRPGSRRPLKLAILVLATALSGCAHGPEFVRPVAAAPEDWSAWRSTDESLRAPAAAQGELSPDWWRAFEDPVLDDLEQRAFQASPDLRTAALRFAQARVQRTGTAALSGPQVDVAGAVTRQRLSENGAGSRVLRAIAGDKADPFIALVSQPFTLYQAGLDASWELDLWGRVARSIEAADADVERQLALLDLARLSIAGDIAQNYFDLRSTQRLIRLLREDIDALQDRVGLLQARVRAGVQDHLDLERQGADLAALKAQLPPLLAQEGASANRIGILLGEQPGLLRAELQAGAAEALPILPDLTLGLPSEVAHRRPDIRAAEARLHNATAGIGVARADLYPSIRIGAHAGYESYLGSAFTDWGSRAWSIGPSLDLPLFDYGRRKSVVQLRELQQQEAAIAYQRTVLQAWQEIDDALSGYNAERQHERELAGRVQTSRHVSELVQSRYNAGTVDFLAVLDAQRVYLQARRDLVNSQGRLATRFVTVNRAIGNV